MQRCTRLLFCVLGNSIPITRKSALHEDATSRERERVAYATAFGARTLRSQHSFLINCRILFLLEVQKYE